MTEETQPVTINFRPESVRELREMARKLSTTPAGVISQALALFRMVQGRTVLLKEKQQHVSLEIKKYADKPALVEK